MPSGPQGRTLAMQQCQIAHSCCRMVQQIALQQELCRISHPWKCLARHGIGLRRGKISWIPWRRFKVTPQKTRDCGDSMVFFMILYVSIIQSSLESMQFSNIYARPTERDICSEHHNKLWHSFLRRSSVLGSFFGSPLVVLTDPQI